MNFEFAVDVLNSFIKTRQPLILNSGWIYSNAPCTYRYIWKHVRTDLGDIDWDRVISSLDREFQKRWVRRIPKRVKQYRNSREVQIALRRYLPKLYIFISPQDEQDRLLRNTICIALVRVAQKGNIYARERLMPLLRYLVNNWIEFYYPIKRWEGYTDDIDKIIDQCIRCYRFTGSFIGYLFKTLEYAGRGRRAFYAYSLDSYIPNTKKRIIDNIVYDESNQVTQMYSSY